MPSPFLHVGFYHYVRADKVEAIVARGMVISKPIEDRVKEAKAAGLYLNLAHGHMTRSYVFMESGRVYGSAFTPETLDRRASGEKESRT